jgi:hypothetical protein
MKAAEIGLMKGNSQDAKIFAVVQFGGSTGELYLHSFSKRRLAESFIKSAARASYECSEVFEIPLPAEGNLTQIAAKTVKWLKKKGYGEDEQTKNLERAMLEVKKDLMGS